MFLFHAVFLWATAASASRFAIRTEGGPEPVPVVHDSSFVPDAILRVTHDKLQAACSPEKPSYLVNGTYPGPALRIPTGKTTWIRVYNDVENHNLTMHWHGLSLAVSPFSDGTPQVSQWPIGPLHFFDYEMHVPEDRAGTYFYHSHVGFQASTAAGPLIVEDAIAPPYEYAEERIMFIGDIFDKTDEDIEKGLTSNPFVWSGEAAMVLLNGRGGGNNNGTFCNASLPVIDVKPDTTYRFRFIGATALSFVSLEVEGHDTFSVIEADGHYTQPYDTPFMQVGPGQRFSALFKTLAQPEKSTYIIQMESRERPTVTRGFAILRYSDPEPNASSTNKFYPPEQQPWQMCNTSTDWLEYELKPLVPIDFPTADKVTRTVTMTTHQYQQGFITWRQNGHPWTETYPQEPYLVSLYKSDHAEYPSMERALANDGIDPVTRVFPAQIGEIIDLVIQNTGSDNGGVDIHPFHVHGASIMDLGSGRGRYNATENERKLIELGVQPVYRDTTMLYRYGSKAPNGTAAGWRAWRMKVTQPGAWMIHCHILQHMVMGMQTVWVFGNETELLASVPQPQIEGYLNYGGSAYGNSTHDPVMVAFQDGPAWTEGQ
ncbi:hypothetical protein HYALB_00013558 [Hymenoscyphus albidus]|uniref:L-ascorbate oxidase n=1 Tax=Hymenoscyphus albidus TaxID=595503 RepID=A0A9N9LYQ4_9HELO|nr:hypothetical protein HYALB_00013558 [Hymenoscyphus albidus]